jgi:hypothetical protein
MRIRATCSTCDRHFLLSQIGPESDAPARCPFCGAHFAPHYSTILVDAVQAAEAAVTWFVQALGRVRALETGFVIDLDGLLRSIAKDLRAGDVTARKPESPLTGSKGQPPIPSDDPPPAAV